MKNNKIYKYKNVFFASVALISIASCNDYLDINENPNSVHMELVTPDLIFPGTNSQIFRTQATTMNVFGNLMMNSWAGNSYAFGSPYVREFNLNSVDNSFYNAIWDGLYRNIANYKLIENFPNSDGSQDIYIAASKIMRAFYMQTIIDLYGDAPFTEAFQYQSNLTPKYDNDTDIYHKEIEDLEAAIALINNANSDAIEMNASTDNIFQGNKDNWKKFANTIKLRYLVRMSRLTGAEGAYRDQKLATLAGAQFLTADVLINPNYSAATDAQQNPFYGTYIRTATGSRVGTVVTVSEHFATALNGNPNNLVLPNNPATTYTKYTGLVDPRRGRFFSTVSGALRGIRQGALAGEDGAPTGNNSVSRIGIGITGEESTANTITNITLGSSKSGVIMSLSEIEFLLAEAGLRYPSVVSSPEVHFANGINASFTYLGATGATAYMANANTRPGLGWIGTTNEKMEAIMTQSWIANTSINPIQSFINYNKTGYPYTPLATTTSKPNKPYRLVYPVSEYVANSANVPNVTSNDVFIKNQYTPFWNQN
ncbi:SusD/RagB family nutrient-binding outer membrane lipoprotein [Chryseobacterium schmidteae]|uniref:SusD/RagB family nutrient-binding outer membrane lipoprotein n=1 Tax=Chryseobacterium schmidteae TaxID=2730404 RepID=UPI00158934A0|nr:SusD/RagB family nutrient-binding outer membrane lipoprotein [Chryseobacterium schmidteae]